MARPITFKNRTFTVDKDGIIHASTKGRIPLAIHERVAKRLANRQATKA
jgi:hypothetical protein